MSEAKLKSFKTLVASIVQSEKGGVPARNIYREYKGFTGEPVPYRDFGYADVDSFLDTLTDIFRPSWKDGEKYYMYIPDSKTVHLSKMIDSQRPKKKSSKARFVKSTARRPMAMRPSWRHSSAFSPSLRLSRPMGFRGQPRPGMRGGQTRPAIPPRFARMANSVAYQQPQFPTPQLSLSPQGKPMARVPPHPQNVNFQKSGDSYKGRTSSPSSSSSLSSTSSSSSYLAPLPPKQGKGDQLEVEVDLRVLRWPSPDKIVITATPNNRTSQIVGRPQAVLTPAFNKALDQVMSQGDRSSAERTYEKSRSERGSVERGSSERSNRHSSERASSERSTSERISEKPSSEQISSEKKITENGVTMVNRPEVSKKRSSKSFAVDITQGPIDFKGLLLRYAGQKKLPQLQFETMQAGKSQNLGYVSSVSVDNNVYGSYGVFRSKREAEQAAARHGCESLGLVTDESTDSGSGDGDDRSSPVEDTMRNHRVRQESNRWTDDEQVDHELLRERVWNIVCKRQNGLWNNRLPIEYREMFKEKPPAILKDMVEEWTDIVRVESVQGRAQKILYPVKHPATIRLLQNSQLPVCTVAPPELPKAGTKVYAYITQVIDCHHFYVQSAESTISELMKSIQDTYEARGSPKQLISATVGMYCVAQYSDNLWYRAKITAISTEEEQTHYDVCYVDYGNCEKVSSHRVRRILDNFSKPSAQAWRCCLLNVFPTEGEDWPVECAAIKALTDLVVEEQGLVMDVERIDAQKGCMVQLCKENDLDFCVNKHLVQRGMAASSPVPSEPAALVLPAHDEWEVYICYIDTTTNITIRLVGPEYSKRLEELEEKLGKVVKAKQLGTEAGPDNHGVASSSPSLPQQGSVCIVCLEDRDDGVSYLRARVVNVDPDTGKAVVEFLDHGDLDLVDLSVITPLPAKYNKLPYQAIPAKLSGLEPYEKDERVFNKLMDTAFGKTCIAQVNDRMDKVSVTLWDTATDEDVNINETVACVLRDEDLTPQLPEAFGTVEGFVSFVAANGQVYFQIQGPGLQRLEEVMEEILDIYGKEARADLFVSAPERAHLCVAKYTDGDWYRAEIKQVLAGRKVEVYFVDYGNTEILSFSSLRELPSTKPHLASLPYQTVECSMYGLPPSGREWTGGAIARVLELLPPDQLRILEVVTKPQGKQAAEVEIYFMEEDSLLMAISEILYEEEHLFDPDYVAQPEEQVKDSNTSSNPSDSVLVVEEDEVHEVIVISDEDEEDGETEGGHATALQEDLQPAPLLEVDENLSPFEPEGGTNVEDSELEDYDGEVTLTEEDFPLPEDCTQEGVMGEYLLEGHSTGATPLQEDLQPEVTPVEENLPPFETEVRENVDIASASEIGAEEETNQENIDSGGGANIASHPSENQTAESIESLSSDLTNEAGDTAVCDNYDGLRGVNGVEDHSHRDVCAITDLSAQLQSTSISTTETLQVTTNSGHTTAWSTASRETFETLASEHTVYPPPLARFMSGDGIYVQYIIDPSNFWCIREDSRNKLAKLMQEMMEYYEKQEVVGPGYEFLQVGDLFAGFFDQAWYRVLVNSVIPHENLVSVNFIDYGDHSILLMKDLRPLPAAFRQLPYQAFRCQLAGIKPTEGRWSEEASMRFTEIASYRTLNAWIYGGEKYSPPKDGLEVTLVDSSPVSNGNTFIHKVLLAEGLALKYSA